MKNMFKKVVRTCIVAAGLASVIVAGATVATAKPTKITPLVAEKSDWAG